MITDAPFLLLEDARGAEAVPARLYTEPAGIVATGEPGEVRGCLERLRAAQHGGLHAAGFLSYEAGHSLEPKLDPLRRTPEPHAPPLLWFGLFKSFRALSPTAVTGLLPDPLSAYVTAPRPLVTQRNHEAAVERVKRHIEAGNIYQANLTFAAEAAIAGSPPALYAGLRQRARAGHGGILFTGEHWLLSLSPELFFAVAERRVTTRPMKGTAVRGKTPAEDADAAGGLRADPKQRAENLMIVDLLRNDLARVSTPGTVRVPALFAIETYPTLHQMTSTVTAELREGAGAVDVLEAIFPCGSITGAPKIRAMEIIGEMETGPRGAYTGSIGWIAPDGDAAFNVAIRTLTIVTGQSRAVIGLGSGIVADSRADDEWRECLAKGAFVADERRFDLIETMRFDPREGVVELERHLARMKRSADALGFVFDRHEARNELQAATFRIREKKKLRLLLSRSGALAIECRPMPPPPREPVEVVIVRLPVPADDFRLRHKTSDRSFYDEAREAAGAFEIVFEDEQGCLTEGSFTNIFVERAGRLVTPPLARGVMPGVLREQLLADGDAEEGELGYADLLGGFFIGNSLRGLMRAIVV